VDMEDTEVTVERDLQIPNQNLNLLPGEEDGDTEEVTEVTAEVTTVENSLPLIRYE